MTPAVIAASTAPDASVWSDLLSVVLHGVGAGIGIAILFSVAIRGLVTASQARRDGTASPATALWGGIGVIAVLACLGAVGLGLVTMLHR